MESSELLDWDAWKQASCFQARERLFCRYYRWAEIEAMQWLKKVGHMGADVEDFVSAAYEGLLLAVDRFDPSKGFKFKTYAQYKIRGSILNQVFKYSEKGQVYQKSEQLKVTKASSQNTNALDSNPLNELVSLIQELTVEYLLENSELDEEQIEALGDSFTSLEMHALKAQCLCQIEKVGQSEKMVLELIYIHNLELKTVASLLGLSKGRVSQLHKQGIKCIRDLVF